MIRVLIVDDHAVVRAGLRRLLDAEEDIETVGEAPNADRAVFEALDAHPDVVLMDLVMPEKGASRACPLFSRRCRRPGCSFSPCRTIPAASAQPSRRARAGTSSRKPPTPRSSPRSARSRQASGTSIRRSARSSWQRSPRIAGAPSRIRCPSASGDPPAPRIRPHEPGDREAAVHLRSHGGDAPSAHHAEARPLEPCRARPLRARRGPARVGLTRRAAVAAPLSSPREVGAFAIRDLRLPDHPVTGCVDGARCAAASASRPKTANARITSPMPVKSSATPTTMPNTASRSAM